MDQGYNAHTVHQGCPNTNRGHEVQVLKISNGHIVQDNGAGPLLDQLIQDVSPGQGHYALKVHHL
jgi:hypothetical protein